MTTPRFSAPSSLLIGRGREQAVLRDHLAAMHGGRGSLVLIGGEAGIGKTALADALCDAATAQGARVLVGHCYDLAETPPYGPWVELFGRYQPTNGDPPLPTAFAQHGTVREVTSQTALFQQVQDFLMTLATSCPEGARPVILLLDDLHWADPASLDLLRFVARFLARSLTTLPLLLLVIYRSDELTRRHPLYTLLPTLVRDAHAERLDLHPLTESDLRPLIGARYHLGPADTARLIAYLHERGEGNPFFLGELLRTLEEEAVLRLAEQGWHLADITQIRVPSLVRQVITGRLTRLGAETLRLLAIAAVIGQEVPLALWAMMARGDQETLLAVIERAIEARVLEETADRSRVRFVHALIRETLYEGIALSQRHLWHRQMGEILARRSLPDPDAVAHHFRQAGDARAAHWLIQAGERAHRAYAWLTAAERFEAALTLMDANGPDAQGRGWLLYRLARLRRFASASEGFASLDEANRLAAVGQDHALSANILLYRGLLHCFDGAVRQGLAEMEDGITALAALPAGERAPLGTLDKFDESIGRGSFVLWLAQAGRYAEACTIGERDIQWPLATIEADGPESISYADTFQGIASAYAGLGRSEEAHLAFAHARELNRAVDHHVMVGWTAANELRWVVLPYRADDLHGREHLAAVAEQAWTQAREALGELPARVASLPLVQLEGHWSEAHQLALAARVTGGAFGVAASSVLAPLAYAQGNIDLAWTLVWEGLSIGPATEPGGTIFPDTLVLHRVAATLATDTEDHGAARAWLEAHDRWLDWSGSIPGRSEGQALWTRYYRATGDRERAWEHATAALSYASIPRQPLALIAAHRLLGELGTAAERFVEAQTHLDAALADADACAAPYERALTLLAQAELYAASGRRDVAVAFLHEVRTICTPLDAKPTLARADALTARLSPHVASIYPALLTEREVEVLRLVAAGHTNRQIADTLSLSPRTIDVHVRNIFAKTDTENRAGATAFAFRHSLA